MMQDAASLASDYPGVTIVNVILNPELNRLFDLLMLNIPIEAFSQVFDEICGLPYNMEVTVNYRDNNHVIYVKNKSEITDFINTLTEQYQPYRAAPCA